MCVRACVRVHVVVWVRVVCALCRVCVLSQRGSAAGPPLPPLSNATRNLLPTFIVSKWRVKTRQHLSAAVNKIPMIARCARHRRRRQHAPQSLRVVPAPAASAAATAAPPPPPPPPANAAWRRKCARPYRVRLPPHCRRHRRWRAVAAARMRPLSPRSSTRAAVERCRRRWPQWRHPLRAVVVALVCGIVSGDAMSRSSVAAMRCLACHRCHKCQLLMIRP